MNCRNCIWAIWYYGEVVECCNTGKCSPEAYGKDIEREDK